MEEMAEQNEQDATGFVEQHEEQVESLKTNLKKSEALKKDALARLREVEEDKNVVEVSYLLLDVWLELIARCTLERTGFTPPRTHGFNIHVCV